MGVKKMIFSLTPLSHFPAHRVAEEEGEGGRGGRWSRDVYHALQISLLPVSPRFTF